MSFWLELLVAFAAGGAISLFYFGGLWLTLRWLPQSSYPGLLVAGSFFVRLALSLLAFFLVAHGDWQRLLAAILGFFVARPLLMRKVPQEQEQL